MKNYKNYFEADNSCYLIDKFSVEKRNGAGEELEDFWSGLMFKNQIGGETDNNFEPNGATKKTSQATFKTLQTMGVKVQSESNNQ